LVEEFVDDGEYFFCFDISYDEDCEFVRSVPFVVVSFECFTVGAFDDFFEADGPAIGKAGTGHHCCPHFLLDSFTGAETGAVFFEDDSAFFFDFCG